VCVGLGTSKEAWIQNQRFQEVASGRDHVGRMFTARARARVAGSAPAAWLAPISACRALADHTNRLPDTPHGTTGDDSTKPCERTAARCCTPLMAFRQSHGLATSC